MVTTPRRMSVSSLRGLLRVRRLWLARRLLLQSRIVIIAVSLLKMEDICTVTC
jgi:hypothetical protein